MHTPESAPASACNTGLPTHQCPLVEGRGLDEAGGHTVADLTEHQHVECLSAAQRRREARDLAPVEAAQHKDHQQVGHKHAAPEHQLALQETTKKWRETDSKCVWWVKQARVWSATQGSHSPPIRVHTIQNLSVHAST